MYSHLKFNENIISSEFNPLSVHELDLTLSDSVEIRNTFLSRAANMPCAVIFSGCEPDLISFLDASAKRFDFCEFLLLIDRKLCFEFIQKIKIESPLVVSRLRFLPLSFDISAGNTLTCKETFNYINSIQKFDIPVQVATYRDFQISQCVHKNMSIQFNTFRETRPLFSIIIPTRNSPHFLSQVIHHLSHQDLHHDQYEVIVVNDGGNEQSLEVVRSLVGPITDRLQFKFIDCPRAPGEEKKFKAGFCRNVGTKESRGEWLVYLDSDIIVENNFLSKMREQLHDSDVIQCPRRHIIPELSHHRVKLEELKTEQTYIEEEKYWGPFFKTQDWSTLPHAWRYTCTYCLAVRRTSLQKVGLFREIFDSYGFEDTELGYRLFKAGYRFKLWKKNVFHLTPFTDQSRYRHSMLLKQKLLMKTGKIFFLSTLDLEVYQLLSLYMGGEYRILQHLYQWRRRLFHSSAAL